MLSYRTEIALQGALQFSPKVEDWNLETIFYGHYRFIFNHCDIMGLKICQIRWKTQNKGYYGIQCHSRSSRSVLGTNGKSVCDFLLVNNSNWHPIPYRLPPFGGLDNVRCSSWAHWKARSGLFISVNWSFFTRCYG